MKFYKSVFATFLSLQFACATICSADERLRSATSVSTPLMSLENRIALFNALPNWHVMLEVFKTKLSSEDIVFIKSTLSASHISLEDKIDAKISGRKLYLGKSKQPVVLNENSLNLDGRVIRYDNSKSFSENYSAIRTHATAHYGLGDLFISPARADVSVDVKEDSAIAGGALLTLAVAGYFLLNAPTMAMVGVATVGVLTLVISTLLPNESVLNFKDLTCALDGTCEFKFKDGATIKTAMNGDQVTAVSTDKAGHKSVASPKETELLAPVMRLVQKAYAAGGDAFNEIKMGFTKASRSEAPALRGDVRSTN